jgi:hypothetical protein
MIGMIRITEKTLFTFIITAFVGWLLYLTLNLSPVSRQVAMAVVTTTFVLLVFQLIIDLLPGLEQRYRRFDKADLFGVERFKEKVPAEALDESVNQEGAASRRQQELNLFFWILLLLGSLLILGLMVALPLYTLLYLRYRSGERWRLSIVIAAAIGGLLYGVFTLALNIHLYEGRFWSWIGF